MKETGGGWVGSIGLRSLTLSFENDTPQLVQPPPHRVQVVDDDPEVDELLALLVLAAVGRVLVDQRDVEHAVGEVQRAPARAIAHELPPEHGLVEGP